MTRYILLVAASILFSANTIAQTMEEALQKTLMTFDTTRDMTLKQAQANRLGLIAKKWNDQWVTHYYNAYGKTMMAYMEQDPAKKDAYLDDADNAIEEAKSLLGKEDDEIYVMQAMIASARIGADPRNRWKEYGKRFDDNLREAKELNEENPRIYYLKGTSTFYRPKAFGGGAKKALPYFEKAKSLFEKESDTDVKDPYWGKYANNYFIAQCSKKDKDDDEKEEAGAEEASK